MKFLLLCSFFSLIISANNTIHPKVYASLGNEIYTNVSKIQTLAQLEYYKSFQKKIQNYATNVRHTKTLGFHVASGARSNVKLDYLSRLRSHKKVNDYFLKSAYKAFRSSLQTQDNALFIAMVNSGLINVRAKKRQIMSYYKEHKEDINPKGIIQTFVDEEKASKKRKRWKPKTKKQLQEEKIARLRKNDALQKKALEQKLSREVRIKKEKIRKAQEKELFN